MIQKFIEKLSAQEKKIFYATVGVVVLALFDCLFFGPVMSKLDFLEEEIKQEMNNTQKDFRLLVYKEKILKERVLLEDYFINTAKTKEELIGSFLKKVEMLAVEANVILANITPTEEQPKKGYVEYYAQLEAAGDLKDMIKFLYLIDSSEGLLKTIKMNLTAAKVNSDEVTALLTVASIVMDSSSKGELARDLEGFKEMMSRFRPSADIQLSTSLQSEEVTQPEEGSSAREDGSLMGSGTTAPKDGERQLKGKKGPGVGGGAGMEQETEETEGTEELKDTEPKKDVKAGKSPPGLFDVGSWWEKITGKKSEPPKPPLPPEPLEEEKADSRSPWEKFVDRMQGKGKEEKKE